jgi:hypothetical protein
VVAMIVVAIVVITPSASRISSRTSISTAPTEFGMRVAVIFPHAAMPAITTAVMDLLETTIASAEHIAAGNANGWPKRGRVCLWSSTQEPQATRQD